MGVKSENWVSWYQLKMEYFTYEMPHVSLEVTTKPISEVEAQKIKGEPEHTSTENQVTKTGRNRG